MFFFSKLKLNVSFYIFPAARVEIIGSPALYVQKGSTINLTCQITDATQVPVYVFWYHKNKVINYENPRNWMTVKTEKSVTTTSKLKITSATDSDSGIYECAPSYADRAQIMVSIINGSYALSSNTFNDPSAP